ncbi:hypothetical protein SUGI_0295900 [Cryptomeria japonica]|nr:hypothetical protein SUGI_0295900 [Cryptomeria japonica]
MKKANNYVEPHPSDNAAGLVTLSIYGKCYDCGSIGQPLQTQGDLVKHNPSTGPRFNQPYRIPNCAVVNEPQVCQDTKWLQEFNLVESTKACYDVTSVNQAVQVCNFKCPQQQKSDN